MNGGSRALESDAEAEATETISAQSTENRRRKVSLSSTAIHSERAHKCRDVQRQSFPHSARAADEEKRCDGSGETTEKMNKFRAVNGIVRRVTA